MGRNEELVTQIQQGKTWLLEELWECNKALVVYISARYQDGCGRHFDTADLLQAGYLGLHVAAMTYSPGRGAAFSTYAFFHIRKAMREVAGLHGKRDVIFQSIPFDAPLGEDGDDTLLDLIPCSQGADLVELQELQSIVRTAVDNIKDTNIRDIIQAVYWKGESIADYAASQGISRNTANEWLQKGYAILRRDWNIVSLALAQGYDTDYYRYKGLSAFRSDGTSAVEDAIILQDAKKRQREALYRQLGDLVEIYTDWLIDK